MKKKYKRAGTTSERQDYRKGGQVSKDGPRQKFSYGGAQGDGDIGLASIDALSGQRVLPEGSYKVRTEQEFAADYARTNPPPPAGGKAGGAKRRNVYAQERGKAYQEYLDREAKIVNKTPLNKVQEQATKNYEATAGKRPPSAPRQRGKTQAQKNWHAGLSKALKESKDNYNYELSTEIEQKVQESKKNIGYDGPGFTGAQMATQQDRRDRIERTGQQAESLAAGNIPDSKLPKAEVVEIPLAGTEVATQTIAPATPVGAEQISQVPSETVTTVDDVSTVAPMPTLTPAQIEATQVTTAPTITAATTEVTDDALAQTAGVEKVPTIEAAKIDIKEGALANRVVGQLSTGALTTAAQAGGTTLARVTRAKRQLRNAGLTEDAINSLGNNPEALEDRLTDFTEAERGLIAGLPEEALVSNQLDSLLKGIENGEIPTWAQPAVSAVEQMLAQRGLEASSVGRDSLVNTIIQSAAPLAQANAQALQQSIAQERSLIAQEELANTQLRQQSALQNAQNVFNLNMAQFSADQQTELANSKFLQTVSISEANNEQQATIQNAILLSQANLAQADVNTKLAIQNAQAFLQTDLANLNTEQQSMVLKAQQQQQTLLSNQAAQNVATQFNATSENQVNQYMSNLATQINQYNASQLNAMEQFNVQLQNAAAAREAQRTLDVNKANAAIINQVTQFNAQLDFNRDQWNAANAQAVEMSNIDWRRKANTANTAAQNAVNQQNVQNAFQISNQAQAFLWQELRDQADYDFKFADNTATRKVQAMIAAASSEGAAAANWNDNFNKISGTVDLIFGAG